MNRKLILFYRSDREPQAFYRIRNAALRNIDQVIEYMPYRGDAAWREFLSSFTLVHRVTMLESNVSIDAEHTTFIGMYKDPILMKDVIVTEPQEIIRLISE